MHLTPYDTFIGKKAENPAAVIEAITRARINHFYGTSLMDTPTGDLTIHMVTEEWKDVPFFTQVIAIDDVVTTDTIFYVDVRQMTTLGRDGKLRFKSSNERLFTVTRVLLTAAWMSGKDSMFASAADWPSKVFSQWMGRAIARTYPINPATQVRILILSNLFFRSQFIKGAEDAKMSERERTLVISQIARATKAPDNIVSDVVTEVGGWISTVEQYCEAIVQHSENLALENMNLAKLFTSLGGTWYGASADEHIAVALEYPPTFYAMLLTAGQDNSYRKTMIGEIVKDNLRDPGARQLQLQMKPLILL